MITIDLIQNILVYTITYIPPLIIYIKFWKRFDKNKFIIALISLIYLGASLYTQNILPFILVVLNIMYLKVENEEYEKYNFSIRKFKFLEGLKYSIYSYGITIIISIITMYVFTKLNVGTKEQEVVTWMVDMSLVKYIITMPVALIFAPVLEEFVFRWFFFEKVFKKSLGLYLSASISSAMFAIVHFNLRAFPMILGIGLFNCYLIEKKGYWYAVFNHFFFNFVTVMLLLQQKL